MRKGKFGILLSYYAVLAFVLVILNQTLLCGLLFLVALLFEKDEWLGRQTLQAFGLSLVVSLFSGITGVFSSWLFNFSAVFSVISTLVWIAAIILSIVAIINCLKERDAGIPVLSDIAYKAYGVQKPSYKPPVQQHPYYQQQQQQLNYQRPPYEAPQQPVNPPNPANPSPSTYTAANPNIPSQQFQPQAPEAPNTANPVEEKSNDQTPPTPPPTQI